MSKRLLQLNVTANWGSTGKIAEGIGVSAIERGWDSAIAYGRYMNPSSSKLIKVGNKFDVYCHYIRNRIFDEEGLGGRKAAKQLINQIKEYNPDIIQLHNIHDHWLNYPLLFEYFGTTDTPIVWTFHDCWAFTGGCYHFENDNCFKWEDENCRIQCHQRHFNAARNFKLKRDLFTNLGQRLNIVCVSDWMAEYVCRSFFGKSANIYTIKNGIDIHGVFQTNETKRKRMILGVSNVWPDYKGLKDFIELRELLKDDIEIVLVGLGKKQIMDLPDGIKGIERTANATELADLYRSASVFVNPTHNDTFPTVNLEALACGTPIVTYRTGGSPEAVDANTGIVVEKGNVHALAHAVMEVLDNPIRFTAESCRHRAEINFDKDIQFGKYIELYDSLLDK